MSWQSLTVGDLVEAGAATIQTGPFGTQLKASDYVEEGTPVINVRNIGFGDLKPEKLEFVTDETAERLANIFSEDKTSFSVVRALSIGICSLGKSKKTGCRDLTAFAFDLPRMKLFHDSFPTYF